MSRGICTIEGCGKRRKARGLCDMHDYRWRMHGDPSICTTNRDKSSSERFWMKIQKGPGCWIWTAGTTTGGYGKFTDTDTGKTHVSHRLAYERLVGQVPEGMVLDHICHVKRCCNPDHLRPVTTKQNGENRDGAPRHSRTGVRGVSLTKRGQYKVSAGHNGASYFGGNFSTLEEAAEAARQLRLSLFTHNELDRKVA